MWAIVAGSAKGFRMTFEQVLHEVSYANLIMMGATLPSYSNEKEKMKNKGGRQDVIKADDPRNKERVRAFFNSIE